MDINQLTSAEHAAILDGLLFGPIAVRDNRPTPSLAEVLHEQMDYLLTHIDHHGLPDCVDCLRLEQVKQSLLRPFA